MKGDADTRASVAANEHDGHAFLDDGTPINLGDPIPMFCKACGKPWRFDAASARAYVCPCGSTECVGTVTFRG